MSVTTHFADAEIGRGDAPKSSATTYAYTYTFHRQRIAERPSPCDSPESALGFVQDAFEGAESERLIVVALDRKNRPLGRETLYQGTVSGTHVRIAELFRLAIRLNASAIILAHNHPSGDPTPSEEDIRMTRDARAAGQLLGITVLDHLVIGDDGARSIIASDKNLALPRVT